MLRKLQTLPGLVDVNSDQQNRGLQASLVIDRDTASRLGITPQMIDDTLYDAFGQRQVSTMYTQLNQYHVVMEVAPEFWQSPETLKDIYVRSATGAQVPLSAFAHFAPATTALAVNHQGQFPAVTLSFNLAPGVALGDAVTAIAAAEREIGLPASIRASFQGTAQAFQASLANEPLLILAALVAVYIVLGMLYESYIHPLTILSTLPSAGVGALLALLLCRTDLSVIALIGIILLIGIVKKNAIMMIDFALDAERKEGKPPEDAIYEACLLRFRPIMMTTMAALLGALPLALGLGTGAELRRPLGITIVGGLIVSQLLTLYTTPVIYLYLDRFSLVVQALAAEAFPRTGSSLSGASLKSRHASSKPADSAATRRNPSAQLLGQAPQCTGPLPGGRHGLCPFRQCRQLEHEPCALSLSRTLGAQRAAVQLRHMAGDRQSQAEAPTSLAVRFALVEALEDVRQCRGIDARPGITDENTGVRVHLLDHHFHRAVFRSELHRIRQEVPEHLLQTLRVAQHQAGAVQLCAEVKRLGLYRRAHRVNGGMENGAEIQRMHVQSEMASRQARDIEQILDQSRFGRGVAFNNFQRPRCDRRIGASSAQYLGPTQNGTQRRPQFV